MIHTIKKILEFDISDDKKVELIKALLKDNSLNYQYPTLNPNPNPNPNPNYYPNYYPLLC